MNSNHRRSQIIRSLGGQPKTIKEVARSQRISYQTARNYLSALVREEVAERYNLGNPIRYIVPLEKLK